MSFVSHASATTKANTPAGAVTADTTSQQFLADNLNRTVVTVSEA